MIKSDSGTVPSSADKGMVLLHGFYGGNVPGCRILYNGVGRQKERPLVSLVAFKVTG